MTWHPVALSADIEPATSAGTRLHGRELVVWRDAAGAAHVWDDRCPHRGMRLSFGFVRGDRIACLYHGWQYGPSGRCLHIPAHPSLEVPATIAVERLAVAEARGTIWANEDAATAEPPPAEGAGPHLPVRSLALPCPADALAARLAEDAAYRAFAEAAGARLLGAIQPVAEDRATLHLVVAGEDPEAALRREAALWAEALRRSFARRSLSHGEIAP